MSSNPNPTKHLRWLAGHTIVQNIVALSAAQIATYMFPLITVPYLARVLGVAGWGVVAFAQAFGAYLTLVVEYGFSLSGTREVARHVGNEEKLAEIMAGVQGARVLIMVGAIVVAFAARWVVPIFRAQPDLLWAATFSALVQALSMMWYFQGVERMKLVASLDFMAKALATVGIFIIVRVPTDDWKVLMLQGLGASISLVAGFAVAYREVPFRMPTWSTTWEALHMGWSMFLFRTSVSLYTVGNAFILGLFVPPQFVGFYAGAEKISRAVLSLLNPVNRTLFPRLSRLIRESRARAVRLARISLIVTGLGGAAMGIMILIFAPLLVRIILGHAYAPAVPVLRVLALLPPLIALSGILGIQWMVPLGLDKAFNSIIVIAGVVNMGLAVVLAPSMKAEGMAWAVVSAEAFVTLAMFFHLRWRRLDPISYAPVASLQPGYSKTCE